MVMSKDNAPDKKEWPMSGLPVDFVTIP